MGSIWAKEKLFHSIDARNFVDVQRTLERHPELINEFFDKECTSLPLSRATWIGDLQMVKFLLKEGADPNKPLADGSTALFSAVKRGRRDIADLLAQLQNSLDQEDQRGYNVLDHSILNGHYAVALLLVRRGLLPKNYAFYCREPNRFVGKEIDFETFIDHLKQNVQLSDREACSLIFVPARKAVSAPELGLADTEIVRLGRGYASLDSLPEAKKLDKAAQTASARVDTFSVGLQIGTEKECVGLQTIQEKEEEEFHVIDCRESEDGEETLCTSKLIYA